MFGRGLRACLCAKDSQIVRIEPVDPSVEYWWEDGTRCNTPRDRDALGAQVADALLIAASLVTLAIALTSLRPSRVMVCPSGERRTTCAVGLG